MLTELPAKARLAPGVIASNLSTEIILLDTVHEHYYSLKGVGHRFWELLAEDPSVDQAVACLLDEFEVEDVVLRRDLAALWKHMAERGLVEPAPEAR